MASLSREFGVPTLLGLADATRLLHQGEKITVDATSGRIYRGKMDELLSLGGQCPMFMERITYDPATLLAFLAQGGIKPQGGAR